MYNMNEPYDPKKHDIVELPNNFATATSGMGGYNLQKNADAQIWVSHPKSGMAVEVDVYLMPGEDHEIQVHILCPSCRNSSMISSKRKNIEYTPAQGKRPAVLSVEPFECAWEKGRGTDATAADRMQFGVGLCRARFAIDRNVFKEA